MSADSMMDLRPTPQRPVTAASRSVEIRKMAEAHVVAFVRTLSAEAPKVDSVQPPLTAPSPPPALFCWMRMMPMTKMAERMEMIVRRTMMNVAMSCCAPDDDWLIFYAVIDNANYKYTFF